MSEGTPPPPPDNPYGTGPGEPPPGQSPGQSPGQPYGQAQPGGYEAAPPPPPHVGGTKPGELLDRFVARLLDLILVAVLSAVILTPIMLAMFSLDGASALGTGGNYTGALVSAVITTVINLGYFGYMESSLGRTVGKMVMKLHVVGPSGAKPTFEEAVKRNIWLGLPILGVVPFLGGLAATLGQLAAVITIAIGINGDTVNRRPWTDKFAGTQVLKRT